VNSSFETLLYEERDRVAFITLNRPEVLNAFNRKMQDELHACWQQLRVNNDVGAVVITGAGEKAFCSGVDRKEAYASEDYEANAGSGSPGDTPFMFNSVAPRIGPKSNDLWKPVIAAVNGLAGGGAYYMLGECDIMIASDEASFFDPHVGYGMTAAFEPMELAQRMPLGELARLLLLSVHERTTARRAYEIGLVSEVVAAAELQERAEWIATRIAAAPASVVQGTLRAIWAAYELPRSQAMALAPSFLALGNSDSTVLEGQEEFAAGARSAPRYR